MNKTVIDTNVLIYALDSGSRYHTAAVNILQSGDTLFVPSKVVAEYFAVTSKLGLTFPQAYGFYQEFASKCTLLFPNPNSLGLFEKLLRKYNPTGNRVFDMEIASVALANNIVRLATANVDDFKNISEIEVISL